MNLQEITPIIEKIIKDLLLEKKYPYGRVKMGVGNKRASGNLIDYISVKSNQTSSSTSLEVYMVDYANVVNDGRAKGTYVAPMAIMKWLQSKGINVRDDKGRFVKGHREFKKNLANSINQNKVLPMAFKISNSIKENGIRPTHFMEAALELIKNNAQIEALLGDASMQDLLDIIK